MPEPENELGVEHWPPLRSILGLLLRVDLDDLNPGPEHQIGTIGT